MLAGFVPAAMRVYKYTAIKVLSLAATTDYVMMVQEGHISRTMTT